MARKGQKKATKGKTVVNLNDFVATNTTTTDARQVIQQRPDTGLDWTETDDNEIQYETMNLPSAPRLERKNYDASRIPDAPNYVIRISGLAYDVDEEQLRNYFNIIEDNEIVELNIPRGKDSGDERYSGEAFMTVNSLDALSVVMSKDGENFNSATGSRNRLQMEYRDRYGSWAQNPNSSRDARYGGRERGGRGRDRGGFGRDSRSDETGGNWRDGPRRPTGGFGNDRPGRDDFSRPGRDDFSRGSEPPRQRKTLNLKKRSEPLPENAVMAKDIKETEKHQSENTHESSQLKRDRESEPAPAPVRTGPKPDPFGGAIPCDENKIRDAERRAEEKLKNQMNQRRSIDEQDSSGGRRDDRQSFDRDNRYNREDRGYNSRDHDRNEGRNDGRNEGGRYDSRDRYDRDNRGSYDRDHRGYSSGNPRDDYGGRRGSNSSYDRHDDRGYNRQGYEGGHGSDHHDEPKERRKLNLKKRNDAPVEEQTDHPSQSPQAAKSNPFGAAKPVDMNVQLKKEQEIQEKEEKRRREQEERPRENRDPSGRKILVLNRKKDNRENRSDNQAGDSHDDSTTQLNRSEKPRWEPQEPRPMPQVKETKKGIDVAVSKFAGLQMDEDSSSVSEEESREKAVEVEEC